MTCSINKHSFLYILCGCGLLLLLGGCPPKPGPWHPEITFRPRLLYTEQEAPEIRARIQRPPYDGIYERVRDMAAGAYHYSDPSGPYDHANEPANGNIAKACAFVYAMEADLAYGRKAADILLHVQAEVDKAYNTDLPGSEALTCYCQALDTLMGAGYDEGGEIEAIKALLGSLADSLYTKWILENNTFFNYWLNNHQAKVSSAIGMAAVTLNQDPRATDWINYGVTVTDLIVNRVQAPPGGGFGEGANYYTYSAVNHLPFMWAFHRFLGGKGEEFSLRIPGPFMRFHLDVPRYYDDFLSMPQTRNTIDWLIKVRLPNGQSPNFDDANLTYRYSGMFNGVWQSGVYAWDWFDAAVPCQTGGSVDLAADMISTYDDTVPAEPPSWPPTQFMPRAGNAVLRSDWTADATYLLLMGEHGLARLAGIGHEHPDPTHMIVYAKGRLLAIDSGYIDFAHHDMVNRAKNHSLLLVDGRGPLLYEVAGQPFGAGSPSFIEAGIDTGFLDHVSVRTAYAGIETTRGVIFPDHKYFIVYDDISSPVKHTYDWLLHGNALQGFALEDSGGTWTVGDAALKSYVTSTQGAPQTSSYPDVNATAHGAWEEHAVLDARIEARSVKFLSVLYPFGPGDSGPLMETVLQRDRQVMVAIHEDKGRPSIAYAKENAGRVEIPAAATGSQRIDTNASVFYLKAVPDGAAIRTVFLKDCSSFAFGGVEVFRAIARFDMALRFFADRIEGYALPARADSFRIRTGSAPANVEGSGVRGFRYLGDGTTRILVTGATGFVVRLP